MTTVCLSELNVLLVYPACSKLKILWILSEADGRMSARSLFPSMRTPLSLSASAQGTHTHLYIIQRLKGAALSVKTQIWCFSNFTCKNSQNHSTAIVFILCVAYLILSDDGTIINQDLEGRASYVVVMVRVSVTISYSSRCLTTETGKYIKQFYREFSCIKIGYSMWRREANKCNNK